MADEKTPQEAAPAAAASAADAPARPARARRPAAAKAPVEAPAAAAEAPAAPTATAPAARVLKVHHLRPAPGAKTARTRVGRGEASKGKSAGRGTKGSKARYQVSAAFEGGQMPLHMRLPKLRGFTSPFRTEYQVVNLDRLSELFPDGGEVGVEQLVAKGAVRPKQRVKVLGTGEITVAVRVTAHAFSASAEQKIAAAGGAVTRA
jgi:large subunit ribosomal protein L15